MRLAERDDVAHVAGVAPTERDEHSQKEGHADCGHGVVGSHDLAIVDEHAHATVVRPHPTSAAGTFAADGRLSIHVSSQSVRVNMVLPRLTALISPVAIFLLSSVALICKYTRAWLCFSQGDVTLITHLFTSFASFLLQLSEVILDIGTSLSASWLYSNGHGALFLLTGST